MAAYPNSRKRTAVIAGGLFSAALLFVFVFHEGLEEPVMNLAGFFIGGVQNHQAGFAMLVAAAFTLVWAFIGVICWLERPHPEGPDQ